MPKHWSPEEARRFLALMEGDRTWTAWAFLLGSRLRVGELVALRWPNVDLEGRAVRVVEFSTYVGYDVVPSMGKSRDAIRSIDLDDGLVGVLRAQRRQQAAGQLAPTSYEASDHVFTRPTGGPYHPQQRSRRGEITAELDLPRLTGLSGSPVVSGRSWNNGGDRGPPGPGDRPLGQGGSQWAMVSSPMRSTVTRPSTTTIALTSSDRSR